MSKKELFITSVPLGISRDYLSLQEFKSKFICYKLLFRLSSYKKVKFICYSKLTIRHPFLMYLIFYWLSEERPRVSTLRGENYEVTLNLLFVNLCNFIFDLIRIPFLIKLTHKQIDSIATDSIKAANIKPDRNLICYLRTDLWFGVQSGGSVGHISGVVNSLDVYGSPLLFTTDSIPLIKSLIPIVDLSLTTPFQNFPQLRSIYLNKHFNNICNKYLDQIPPRFIYQRYSVNSYLGVLLSCRYQVPFVLEYNGSEIWIARNWGSPLRYEALSEKVENANLNVADVVVVVSQPMKDELVARNIDANKILVNPNGVDPERYSPIVDGSIVRKKFGLDNKLVIGFIGTFGPWHGAEVLVEAFRQLLNVPTNKKTSLHLLMIGDGVTLPQIKASITANEMESFCTFTGVVPQQDGPRYLAACDILVSPHVPNPDGSPFFGSPTKLFEYMAMGKGIVASDIDQIGEVLSHNETAWMVKPGDADELARGLERLINDPILCERLGRAARSEVIEKYTWQMHTQRIIKKLGERCGG